MSRPEGLSVLVICNRQKTEHDSKASIRVHGDCDGFMELVLKQLMGQEDYDSWKKARTQRLADYDKVRKKS